MSGLRRRTRREFLGAAAGAGIGYWVAPRPAWTAGKSANDRLNIAMIGTANRAADNLNEVSSQNMVVLCDVDDAFLAKAKQKFPAADAVNDFRKAIERNDVDAVVVSTPDHTHAAATLAALKAGKHVYCEKPLTHTVHEARLVAETARKMGLATQMGTQIHALDNYRRVVELIESGAVGLVREVHAWCGKSWGGGERPTETPPVPANLHWDLWLGPAPARPYHPKYVPFHWRGWWDFGGGTLADMGCHYLDVAFWALKLRRPTRVEAKGDAPPHPETAAVALEVVYEFPERDNLPPVTLTWYDGGKRPKFFDDPAAPKWGDGVLFVGEKGSLITGYMSHKLLPEEKFRDFQPPQPYIPRSIGHHNEWIQACKDGSPTTCNFDYSGALTETVLLGLVSYRCQSPLEWDAEGLTATNCPEADRFIRKEYRKGWEL
jgi:predicted dehydrogenase